MPKETFFNLPDDKRERLLQIAINEFADNDYQNASISRIVKEMGIAKGSFYQYFEDKKDLFMYLIDLSLQEKQQLLGKIDIPAEANMFEMLRFVFQMQVKFDFEHPRLSEVGYRAIYREVP
ncbi:MAG: TetR/AcrR family transcriptional regulator, partial [Anaerolineales bacterium]|nr:TetR/AcrR family transcriptional regulator [Anaerolineales bacterium]